MRSSLKSQLYRDVSIETLFKLITNEKLLHHIDYTPIINGNEMDNLIYGLSDYIEMKICDSLYGDIVPTITANALNTNLIVFEKLQCGYRCSSVGKNANNSTCLPLLVLKCGKHYDGLVSSHDR